MIKKNNNSSRDGAEACLKAIKKMERMSELPDSDYHGERVRMVSTLTTAAGPLTPYLAGFIATLAEYIDLNLGSNPKVLANWRPEAVMTEHEIESRRALAEALF
ncbi:MAG TPA: hypothetical protein VEA39_01855 [Methylophilaceae bacterium]|nr:hypothetical protein [Methylophilaceae bacterium]